MFQKTAELYDPFHGEKDDAGEAARVRELVAARDARAHTLLEVAWDTVRHLMGRGLWIGRGR